MEPIIWTTGREQSRTVRRGASSYRLLVNNHGGSIAKLIMKITFLDQNFFGNRFLMTFKVDKRKEMAQNDRKVFQVFKIFKIVETGD